MRRGRNLPCFITPQYTPQKLTNTCEQCIVFPSTWISNHFRVYLLSHEVLSTIPYLWLSLIVRHNSHGKLPALSRKAGSTPPLDVQHNLCWTVHYWVKEIFCCKSPQSPEPHGLGPSKETPSEHFSIYYPPSFLYSQCTERHSTSSC